jgi:hypothetical protein
MKRLNLNKCVAITKTGELVMVNNLFSDTLNNEPFHGATGAIFTPISQDEIDERNDLDAVKKLYGYLWTEAIKDGNTTDSYDDYMQGLIDSEVNYGDGLFLGHDTSYIYDIPDVIKKTHFDDAESFECVSGGRMFPLKEEDMLLILDQDLWDAVKMIESEPYDLEMFNDILKEEV